MNGKVTAVSGCLVRAEGLENANVSDVVRVGKNRLVGEILNMTEDLASIQMYEDTAGLIPAEEVESTGYPLYIELGPGMLGGIFDATARPLSELQRLVGDNMAKGFDLPTLSREKLWDFVPTLDVGVRVTSGDVIGTVRENGAFLHKIMVPFGVSGTIASIQAGSYTVSDSVCLVKGDKNENYKLTLVQKWPVRKDRPYIKKHIPSQPLISGLRAIDTLFPIAKGGAAAIAGKTGSGKTTIVRQLAKYADADIVVYVGCGVSGNEIAQMLSELTEYKNEQSDEAKISRTIMIATSSDMPIMARDASMYTGITIAEYFRDMGYSVALIADSVTLWADALREMSGRLGELPAEEGYPAYLSSRIAQFYERAGLVECLGSNRREGSLTLIGLVELLGDRRSNPVLQAAVHAVRTLIYLDSELFSLRIMPAINLIESYSLYGENLKNSFDEGLGVRFSQNREKAMSILREETEIKANISLDPHQGSASSDSFLLETARMLHEDFLKQNAYDDTDSFSSLERQNLLLQLILDFCSLALAALEKGTDVERLLSIPVLQELGRAKSISEADYRESYNNISEQMIFQINEISEGGGEE